MKFLSKLNLNPKIEAQLRLFAVALAGQAILVLQGSESLPQAGVTSALAAIVLIRGYLKSASPSVDAIAEVVIPVLEEKIREHAQGDLRLDVAAHDEAWAATDADALTVPEPGVSPATPAPVEVETDPYGNPIVK